MLLRSNEYWNKIIYYIYIQISRYMLVVISIDWLILFIV